MRKITEWEISFSFHSRVLWLLYQFWKQTVLNEWIPYQTASKPLKRRCYCGKIVSTLALLRRAKDKPLWIDGQVILDLHVLARLWAACADSKSATVKHCAIWDQHRQREYSLQADNVPHCPGHWSTLSYFMTKAERQAEHEARDSSFMLWGTVADRSACFRHRQQHNLGN